VKRVEPWLWKRLAALADVDLGRTWAARVAARGEITLVSQIDDLKGQLAGATLVVDARLQGLRDGVLDDKAGSDTVVETLDGGAGWPGVPYRVRRRDRETAESSDDAWIDEGTSLVLDRDAEGAPIQWLAVERRRDEANTENGRSTARRAQLLSDHQEWARTEARAIGAAVGVTGDLARTLEVAALLHDEGKRARVWQRAFRAPADGPYAKTRGPLNTHLLHGYRHEFGSLPYAQEHPEFHLLPPEFQDLGLHLIAAHHGQARPLISTEGCEDLPPSSLRGRAQEVAIRFARLQMQWGPWGLAWWEALLRAADQRASRANDAGDSRGAQEVA
jgi:CRISPR-associated endonuclease/helicase Cas3